MACLSPIANILYKYSIILISDFSCQYNIEQNWHEFIAQVNKKLHGINLKFAPLSRKKKDSKSAKF